MAEEMEKMKHGTKKQRISVLLDVLKNMRRFYSSSKERVEKEAPWTMIEFVNRLGVIDQNIKFLIDSINKSIKNRGVKIDAPSLDATMDDVIAIQYLAQKIYNPSGDETPYKELVQKIKIESNVHALWLNRAYNYLCDYISQ
jgi:hypothetical protein